MPTKFTVADVSRWYEAARHELRQPHSKIGDETQLRIRAPFFIASKSRKKGVELAIREEGGTLTFIRTGRSEITCTRIEGRLAQAAFIGIMLYGAISK